MSTLVLVAVIGCVLAPAAAAAAAPATFVFTGAEQTYTVPAGVTSLQVVAVGAPGGAGFSNAAPGVGGAGADGATATATLAVTPGEGLYVEVGGAGGTADGTGGFNGGGAGSSLGGGGGGASDVRTVSCGSPCAISGTATLASRLVVAAGGGGGGGAFDIGAGGAGGGTTASSAGLPGADGQSVGLLCPGGGGSGATSAAGGTGGTLFNGLGCDMGTGSAGTAGTLGQGGAAGFGSDSGGGGGGGYYGGGGGAGGAPGGGGGGGGGSSFDPSGVGFAPDTSGVPSVTITPTPPAVAQVTPLTLSFPTQAQSTVSAPQTVTIANVGVSPLTVTGVVFAGADAGDFLVGSSSCGGPVLAGQSCAITVRFVPEAQGPRSASLQIISNDATSPTTVALTGSGGSLPTGPPGATGPPGPAGAPGRVQLITCTTSTKTIIRKGKSGTHHKVRVRHRSCKGRLVSGPVRFVLDGNHARASLSRGRIVYATGSGRTSAHGSLRLVLNQLRPVTPGRYTLTLRVHRARLSISQELQITVR